MNIRHVGFGLGAFAAGAAAWVWGTKAFGDRIAALLPAGGAPSPAGGGEHVPTDLMGDRHPRPGDRAVEAFRPDPTAVPTAEEREALRPATGPAPTLVADRGSSIG